MPERTHVLDQRSHGRNAARATQEGDAFLGLDTAGDLAAGLGGNDELDGRGGNDTLDGGAGFDQVFGGEGDDSITDAVQGGAFFGDGGNDTIAVTLDGAALGFRIANASGGTGDDLISASGPGLSGIFGPGEAVGLSADGDDGNDTIIGSDGFDNADGGADDDSIEGNGGSDNLTGGDGADTISGGAAFDFIIGDSRFGSAAPGNDSLSGGTGSDTIFGNEGNDTLLGGDGDDSLLGGDGDDSVLGGTGNDTIVATPGRDTVEGGIGNDSIDTGADDDLVVWNIGDGNDTIAMGEGNDTLRLEGWTGGDDDYWTVTIGGAGATYRFDNGARAPFTLTTSGVETVTCFAAGTRILTPAGEVSVETLRAGDLVAAPGFGAPFKPLRWVGHTRVDLARQRDRRAVAPVLVRAGALGAGVPHRDLRVSPEHAFLLAGRLVPARLLVNGTSIVQEPWVRALTYWHVELEAHGVVVAEGTLAETYFDDGNRHLFDTAITTLHAAFDAARRTGRYAAEAFAPPVLSEQDPALAGIIAALPAPVAVAKRA